MVNYKIYKTFGMLKIISNGFNRLKFLLNNTKNIN